MRGTRLRNEIRLKIEILVVRNIRIFQPTNYDFRAKVWLSPIMAYMLQARRSTTICREICLRICRGVPHKKYEISLQTKFTDYDIL